MTRCSCRQLLPDLPGELVRMIFQYSQRAPYCLTIGHFTPTPATQVWYLLVSSWVWSLRLITSVADPAVQECESLQLEKFHILLTQVRPG